MYKCDDCGYIFEDPQKIWEGHGEYFCMCPLCSSENFSEITYCIICGEEAQGDYCEDCRKRFDNMFSAFVKSVQNEFDLDHDSALELIGDAVERS